MIFKHSLHRISIIDAYSNDFLYSDGVLEVTLLNRDVKVLDFWNPQEAAISCIGRSVVSRRTLAFEIRSFVK